jgi:hypothetical protein
MPFASLRGSAFRNKTSSRSRVPTTRRPGVESLERRDLPATLVLPPTDLPDFTATFNMSEPGGGTVLVSSQPIAGGNFLGTLNGNTPLTASYCVDLSRTLFPDTTYDSATVTGDGTSYGTAVPQAGALSWLLTHLGPAATTAVQQDALQAAIWRTEYGTGFQLDGVDNSNGAPAINAAIAPLYQADLAALGNNTAPVSAVAWISPGSNPDSSPGQGLVALTGTPMSTATSASTPTPPSVLSVARVPHSKKGLTSFAVTFNEALTPASASSPGLYGVFAGVKKHHKTVYTKPLKIRSVSPGGANTVTINLAKPYKGAVQVTVESGIVGANGASSTSAFSDVVRP